MKPVTIAAEPRPTDLDSTVATLPLPRNPPPVFVQPKMPTPLAAAPSVTPAAIPGSGANSDERSYFITVLGRRLGPLARAVARDLKARELKGTLRPGDLTQYPQA